MEDQPEQVLRARVLIVPAALGPQPLGFDDDVAAFLDNQYYTASIKIFTMSTFLEEVNA